MWSRGAASDPADANVLTGQLGGTVSQPFHVIAKPTGAVCNLACRYCFFLSKAALYPDSAFRMPESVLEAYISQTIGSQLGREVPIAWQGGEPTLMGIGFYRQAVELERKHAGAGTTILNSIQTNGTLIDDDWCRFLVEHQFLVGLSLDGPPSAHDAYRLDRAGRPTSARVVRAARLLAERGVDFNVLCTVHAANADRPVEIYRYFRDDIGARFIQFIPIVERVTPQTARAAEPGWGDRRGPGALYTQSGSGVTGRSVKPLQWGRFLSRVFDEWVRHDVGRVYVQLFDVALGLWLGQPSSLCIFAETCGRAPALEHNGDLYSCDHFVEPKYLLGNILEKPIPDLLASAKQVSFGLAKSATLPKQCRECGVLFACRGECPRNRFIVAPTGEDGLNYLCAGYKAFFQHIGPAMRFMASELSAGRPPANVMRWLASGQEAASAGRSAIGRNEPCPCGSGKRYKHCHGS